MKVKIKKQGKKKIYNTIESWDDVTLERWVKLLTVDTESKTKEAEETIVALSDMPLKLVKELSLRDVAVIFGKLAEIQGGESVELKRVMEIDGVDYGFHPDLSEITLGEYADIESFIKEGLEKNMPEIMAILFRPVLKKKDNAYTIEAYDGNITMRKEVMKKMSASQVQAALFFFSNLGKELSLIMELYSMELKQEMLKEAQTKILQSVGDGSE
tara:strand:+ start:37 stop:678 length:642 start_codon:yes stop_codon:yes gene_type:complete